MINIFNHISSTATRMLVMGCCTFLLLSLSANAQTAEINQNIALAKQYYKESKYLQALDILDEIEGATKRNDLYEIRFNCYVALGKFKNAEKLARNSIQRRPLGFFQAYADLFTVYAKTENKKAQQKFMSDLDQRIERNPGLAYNVSRVFQERGYPGEALHLLLKAEEVNPRMNFAYQKALLYGELGQIKNMFATYVEMVERSPNYLSTVKTLLSRALSGDIAPENLNYLKQLLIEKIQKTGNRNFQDLLIHVFIQEKNFRGAFTQLQALHKRSNGDQGGLFRLGKIALNNEEYQVAREIFTYILKSDNDSPYQQEARLQNLVARRLQLEQKPTVSAATWQKLANQYAQLQKQLQRAPEQYVQLTIQWAHLEAFKLNNIDTAKQLLHRLLNSGMSIYNPELLAQAKVKLGDVLLYSGKRWDALSFYSQVEKDFERSPLGQEAKFKKGLAAYYVGEFEWAQNIFNALKTSTSKLIANDAMRYSLLITDNAALDSNYEAMRMYARADLMHFQGKRDSALTVLSQMEIAFVGHNIQDEVLLLKGDILQEQQQYQKAAKAWEALLNKHSSDILADDALHRLALLYENALNNETQASQYYERIFTRHPDSFFANEARKRFRELRGELVN